MGMDGRGQTCHPPLLLPPRACTHFRANQGAVAASPFFVCSAQRRVANWGAARKGDVNGVGMGAGPLCDDVVDRACGGWKFENTRVTGFSDITLQLACKLACQGLGDFRATRTRYGYRGQVWVHALWVRRVHGQAKMTDHTGTGIHTTRYTHTCFTPGSTSTFFFPRSPTSSSASTNDADHVPSSTPASANIPHEPARRCRDEVVRANERALRLGEVRRGARDAELICALLYQLEEVRAASDRDAYAYCRL
jgi:hypothetical protein